MKKNKGTVPHIYLDQLPQNMQDGVLNNGFTLHKNVMIIWNKMDRTEEILKFIDGLSENIRTKLLIVSNQCGKVDLVWDDKAPSSFDLYNVKIGKKMYPISPYLYSIKR